MKKIASPIAALTLSLLLSTTTLGGEILTPGKTVPPPPPAESLSGDQETSGLLQDTGGVLTSLEFIYHVLGIVF